MTVSLVFECVQFIYNVQISNTSLASLLKIQVIYYVSINNKKIHFTYFLALLFYFLTNV
jgi:hypothetical protein